MALMTGLLHILLVRIASISHLKNQVNTIVLYGKYNGTKVMFFPSYTVVKLLQFVSRLFAIEVVVCVCVGGGCFYSDFLKLFKFVLIFYIAHRLLIDMYTSMT